MRRTNVPLQAAENIGAMVKKGTKSTGKVLFRKPKASGKGKPNVAKEAAKAEQKKQPTAKPAPKPKAKKAPAPKPAPRTKSEPPIKPRSSQPKKPKYGPLEPEMPPADLTEFQGPKRK